MVNPYQNKKESVFYEHSNNQKDIPNRYPFTNNPNAVMKNGNYKDWVNECEGSNVSPSPAAAVTSAIISIVLKTLAKALVSSLVDAIKSSLGISEVITKNNVSQLSMELVNQLINRRIQETIMDLGSASLNGLMSIYKRYLNALEAWDKDKSNITLQENVIEEFKYVESRFFENLKGIYRTSSSQITLLPTFAQAANLHLSMLRDAVMYQEGWNLQSHLDYKMELDIALKDYTNYCVEVYNRGLNALRGSTALDWLEFNSFRRDMTLMVLDLVAIFPNYDPVQYPLPTKIGLSRKIYTDPVGTTRDTDFGNWTLTDRTLANFNDLERDVTDSPSLVKWLVDMNIYTGAIDSYPISGPGGERIGVWYGNMNSFVLTGSRELSYNMYGEIAHEDPITNIRDNDIYKVDLRAAYVATIRNALDSTFGVSSSHFFNVMGKNELYQSKQPYPSYPITITFPGEESLEGNVNDYSHLLCNVKNITGGLRQTSARGRSSLLSHAWTHKSLNPKNIIAADKITHIPAVKGSNLSASSAVIKGPGFTGGDLLRLGPNQFVDYILTPDNPQVSQIYFDVRLRYACMGGANILIQFWNKNWEIGVQLVSTTSSLENLKYENFAYITTRLSFTFGQGGYNMSIYNPTSNPNVIIDKIEFIPVSGTPFEYEGKHKLKNTQADVNNLFLN
uniref:Crystaline entomocidal protoxin n=1 Tax=Bacillus thuringiensis TaxID=1428 RepID=Q6BCH5_BACTU|nr:delta-endotoxin [Bacillus thuringiensis]